MATTITAERIFDSHAVALSLPTLGDASIDSYIAEHAKSADAARFIGAAFDAASLAQHDQVHTCLAQARQAMGWDVEKGFKK